ncbi:MAG: triose-phosphate isomerase [Candidatus Uhrbacteria bacterium]
MNPLIIGNWKMQESDEEAVVLAAALRRELVDDDRLVVCPSFTAIAGVSEVLRGSSIAIGAQDCAPADRGALTGEVSVEELVNLGCSYVLVGHSERRHIFGETDDVIVEKARTAIAHGLTPVLCVGETAEERNAGQRDEVLERQLRAVLDAGVDIEKCIVAYEPVWAIGTGDEADARDVAEAVMSIGDIIGPDVSVLYGGSVDELNVASFISDGHCGGVLVGGASQRLDSFVAVIEASQRV